MGIKTFLPEIEQFNARDKVKLTDFGKKHDFYVPADKIIHEQKELKKIEDDFEFPIVVKGKFYDAIIAHTMDQAEKAYQKIQAK